MSFSRATEGQAVLEMRRYDSANKLVWLYRDGAETTYSYRPDGLRHSKTTGAVTRTHLWDGQEMVAEERSGSITDRYLRGINLVAREQDNQLQYYLHNGHGDIAERTDRQGTALKRYSYDAFGNEEQPEKLDSNPFRYCGEYWDSESGTLYLRARNYDPATGRFQGEDSVRGLTRKLPNKQEIIDPLSLNLYTYGHNNPISNLDRAGNFSIGNIFNGVFMAYLGYAAITVGMAALTVATGGAALIAAATVVAGVGAMSLGASEVIEGVTTYNPMRTAMGDQLYADSVMLTSMGTVVGMQYSGMYYQMYGVKSVVQPLVEVNPNKFTNYVFDESKAPGKSKAFTQLGYSVAESDYLIGIYRRQAASKFMSGEFTYGTLDKWGQRINIEIALRGTGMYADRISYIKSGWMINVDGSISLNTPFTGYTR